MRRYFTRRCLFLHALLVVLVPGFLVAGWWQYTVARGGNELAWVYTVEWPFLAAYGLYMWWKLINDKTTPFDRLWAAKQRAAAQANGTPFYEIPGWATDKELTRELRRAGIGTGRAPRTAIELGPGAASLTRGVEEHEVALEAICLPENEAPPVPGEVIEAEVVSERSEVDEELEAYNRYLFELHQKDLGRRSS